MSVPDIAVIRVIESLYQLDDCRLSTSTCSNECYGLVFGHFDINFLDDLNFFLGRIMEFDIFKGDRPIM